MMDPSSSLGRALGLVDLFQAAERLGVTLKKGLQSRPGENEGKPSFSVYHGQHGWCFKDHAKGDAGGVWQLVALLRPDWSKAEIARAIMDWAGVDPEDGKSSPRKLREDFSRKRRAATERHFAEHRKIPTLGKILPMSSEVRKRYGDGWKGFELERKMHMASDRGFPLAWVEELHRLGKISDPCLPWKVPGVPGAQRGFAFLVERLDRRSGKMVSVGYHQRFRSAEGHGWCFVPYVPRAGEHADVEFLRKLAAEGVRCDPVPFVLGDMAADLWVILEGQWDAAAFWGLWCLLGGRKAFVLGVRGGRGGVGALLAEYGHVMEAMSPDVWLISDNDATGRAWNEDPDWKPGMLKAATFADKVAAWGAARVAHTMLDPAEGKDFNDWLRKRKDNLVRAVEVLACQFLVAFPPELSGSPARRLA